MQDHLESVFQVIEPYKEIITVVITNWDKRRDEDDDDDPDD